MGDVNYTGKVESAKTDKKAIKKKISEDKI